MKKLLLVLTASSMLASCVAVPYDQGSPPPPRANGDRDGDGIPNRYDRAPNNPNR